MEFEYGTITRYGAAFQPASSFDRVFDLCTDIQIYDGCRTTPRMQRLNAYT